MSASLIEGWAVAGACPICVGTPLTVAYSAVALAQATLPAGLKPGAIINIMGAAEVTNDSGVNVGVGRGLIVGPTEAPASPVAPAGFIALQPAMMEDLDPVRHHMVLDVARVWAIPSPNPYPDGAFVSWILYVQTDVVPTGLKTLTINTAELTLEIV